jgi:hypothetical protein
MNRAAVLCALIALAAYTAALSPGAYWLDSSEFAAASFVLGVPHAPGHPLAALLGKLAALLPLGPVAFRVGLAQAACGAASAALLVPLGARLAAWVRGAVAGAAPGSAAEVREARPGPADVLLGAAAALCTSLSYAAAFQSVRPEVYALHRLLSLLALLGLLTYARAGDRRGLLLAALALGLGLANHHFLVLLLCAPVLVLILRRRSSGPAPRGGPPGIGPLREVLLCCAAGAVGLLLYAYLPLRAARHPLVNWGAPSTWGRFLWTVSAQAFQKSARVPEGGDEAVVGALLEAIHPLGLCLAAVGLYAVLRLPSTRRLGAYALLCVLLVAGGRAMLGFDPANPDAHGYLVPAIDLLGLLACAGGAALPALAQRVKLLAPGAAARLALALSLALFCGGALWGGQALPRSMRPGFWDLDTLVGGWLDEAPPRSMLLSSYFQTVFGLWYLQGVEGRRPDVLHLHPLFLGYPGYREEMLARHPGEPVLPRLLGKGLHVEVLLDEAARRRILLEYDLEAPAALVPRLLPMGLAEQVSSLEPGPAPGSALSLSGAAAQARRDEVMGRLDLGEGETRRNLVWRGYLRAHLFCQQGDRRGYEAERARVRGLFGGARSPEMDELERRCGR